MASRHLSMLGGSQESDIGGYRTHPSGPAHYGGQYSSVYGSAALTNAQQVSAFFLSICQLKVSFALRRNCIAASCVFLGGSYGLYSVSE